MPSMYKLDSEDRQGGKRYGQVKTQQEQYLDQLNESALREDRFKEVENLEERLKSFKYKFIEFDDDNTGDLDIMNLKRMLEKLGQPKTHLELKKMIAEVDTTNSGTITYPEFIDMMLGTKVSVLKLILLFEEKAKGAEKPKGPPPKVALADLLSQ